MKTPKPSQLTTYKVRWAWANKFHPQNAAEKKYSKWLTWKTVTKKQLKNKNKKITKNHCCYLHIWWLEILKTDAPVVFEGVLGNRPRGGPQKYITQNCKTIKKIRVFQALLRLTLAQRPKGHTSKKAQKR